MNTTRREYEAALAANVEAIRQFADGARTPAGLDDALRIIRFASIDVEGALAVLRALAGNLAQRPMASREYDLAFDIDQLADQHERVA